MLNELTKGKKTYTSAAIVAVVAIIKYLGLIDDKTAQMIFEMAGALGLYGLYDRVKVNGAK